MRRGQVGAAVGITMGAWAAARLPTTEPSTIVPIGYLHPVRTTVTKSHLTPTRVNIKTFKGQLNNVAFWRLQCPFFIIIVVIV